MPPHSSPATRPSRTPPITITRSCVRRRQTEKVRVRVVCLATRSVRCGGGGTIDIPPPFPAAETAAEPNDIQSNVPPRSGWSRIAFEGEVGGVVGTRCCTTRLALAWSRRAKGSEGDKWYWYWNVGRGRCGEFDRKAWLIL